MPHAVKRTSFICCRIFFLLGLGSRWAERDANLWNEILITYRLIIQTSSHNRDIKDDSLRQDRHDQMRGCPGSQQFAHFMIGSALLKFIMFKNVQYWMTILADAYLILDDLLGGISGSAPPVVGALLLPVTRTTAGWLGQTLSRLGTTTSQPASSSCLLTTTIAPAHALVQTNI